MSTAETAMSDRGADVVRAGARKSRARPYAILAVVVGAAMMQRFLAEGKPGATVRSGAPYSTWFNGGLRTTCHFHNMIGLLTETIGSR